MPKVIKLDPFSVASINNAISELKKFENWIKEKTVQFIDELANEGLNIASVKFSTAQYDGTNDVTVSVEQGNTDMSKAVVAIGNATLFIEFGTGVTYPDNHPEGVGLGMIHGEYGHHLGLMPNGWRYQGDPGTNGVVITTGKHTGEIHTYGNPANMCMYDTVKELENRFEEIARRVYVND